MEVTRRQFLQLGATGVGAPGDLPARLRPQAGHSDQAGPAHRGRHASRTPSARTARSGCALLAYTRKAPDGKVELLQIEGDPDSPVNEGRLCPKGATALQLAVSRRRVASPLYREPGATEWQQVSWDFALDRLARNIKASRDRTFVTTDGARQRREPLRGHRLRRRRRVQLGGGLPRHEADARPRRRPSRTTGPCLTRPHGGQFGRHVWPGGHDQPLA